MHMADSLLSPAVALTLIAVAAAALAWSARQVRLRFDPARVPMMGVLGAFVFAAQMINFPILPGTSGHLVGGMLLAIVLGPHAATLVMASILIVQCLIFQDGGLLALGANIVNLGVLPCYFGYALYRLLAGRSASPRRTYSVLFIAAIVSLVGGAALVPVEVRLSNLLAVPMSKFLLLMVGLHLLIGLVEALITFGVVGYLGALRPELLAAAPGAGAPGMKLTRKAVAGSVLVVAMMLAGVVSLYASEWPDALESLTAPEHGSASMVLPNPSATIHQVEQLHERFSPLPDYGGITGWTSAPGLIGTVVVLVVVWFAARLLRNRQAVAARHGLPIQSVSNGDSDKSH